MGRPGTSTANTVYICRTADSYKMCSGWLILNYLHLNFNNGWDEKHDAINYNFLEFTKYGQQHNAAQRVLLLLSTCTATMATTTTSKHANTVHRTSIKIINNTYFWRSDAQRTTSQIRADTYINATPTIFGVRERERERRTGREIEKRRTHTPERRVEVWVSVVLNEEHSA